MLTHISKLGNGGVGESNVDYGGTLMWDPDRIEDDKLEYLLQTFMLHPRLSSYSEMRENLDTHEKIIVSCPGDSYFTGPPKLLRDDMISKGEMIEIIHQAGYDEDRIREILMSRNIKGWGDRHHRCPLWSLKEVENFEMAMYSHHKDFAKVQKVVKSKTLKELIEFYYFWKQMPRYKKWKESLQHSKGSPLTRKLPSGKTLFGHSNVYRKSEEFDQQDLFLGTSDPLLEFYYSNLDSCYDLEDTFPMNENSIQPMYSQDLLT